MGVVAYLLFASLDTFAECSCVLELNQRPPELRKPMVLVCVWYSSLKVYNLCLYLLSFEIVTGTEMIEWYTRKNESCVQCLYHTKGAMSAAHLKVRERHHRPHDQSKDRD